jgi:hypothetical protein
MACSIFLAGVKLYGGTISIQPDRVKKSFGDIIDSKILLIATLTL